MYPGPYGLRPAGHLSASGSFSGKRRAYPLQATALTVPLVYGNPVSIGEGGGIVECSLAANTAGDASAQDPATSFVGVFVGARKASGDGIALDDQIVTGTPAAGDVAFVVDDPYALFTAITEPQASGGAVAPIPGQAYGFAEAVNSAAAVNEAGKRSTLSVDASVALNNGPVKVLEVLAEYEDDTNTWWEVVVMLNAGHQLLSTADLFEAV